MTQLSPAMDAALGQLVVTIFGAIEIVLPNANVRLLDSSGIVVFNGKTFTGRDATYGTISKLDPLSDGTGDDAPALKLTLIPANDAAAADLAGADMQGSPVNMWTGVVDPSNGLVVGDPLLVFSGILDTVTYSFDAGDRSLALVISSVFEDFFFNDDGCRLSDTFHKRCWPGERGMSFATGITHQIYWGADAPSGVSL